VKHNEPENVTRESRRRPALPKAPTGMQGLDELTGGGLSKGRPTLLCGSAGALGARAIKGEGGMVVAYVARAFGKPPRPATAPAPRAKNALKEIFILLRAQTGHDFSRYKPRTVYRRIERRMGIHQIDRIATNVRLLQMLARALP